MSRDRWTTGPALLVWGIVIGILGTAIVVAVFAAVDDDGDGGDASDGVSSTASTSSEPPATTSSITPSGTSTTSAPDEQSASEDDAPSTTTSAPVVAAAGAPSDQLVACPSPTTRVSDAEQLQAALDAAAPGDTIELADGTYTGKFVASRPGTESQPIFLCGGEGAVLDGDGIKEGYVLHLDGVQHWRLVGFTVQNGQKGVMADRVTHSVIQGLLVQDIGDEAIHLRSASSNNAVLDNTVRRTGLRRDKFGEGVYVGSATSNWSKYSGGEPDRSDNNLIQGNTISQTGSESIDVKEGTTGGRVIGNVMDGSGMTGADSLLDVKGNDWLIEGNTGVHAPGEAMQTHRILEGWGTGNTFTGNTVDVDGDGRHFYVHDPEVTDNKVLCDNRTGSGFELRSNVECVR